MVKPRSGRLCFAVSGIRTSAPVTLKLPLNLIEALGTVYTRSLPESAEV